MGRKQFMIQISAHLQNNKTRGALGALYKAALGYFAPCDDLNNNKSKQMPKLERLISSKSKFITESTVNEEYKSNQFYSFGEKFIYNPKLKNNPMFVEPKYATLKEEWHAYLVRVNRKDDEAKLLREQLQIIETMDKKLRPLLREMINGHPVAHGDALWIGDANKSYEQLKNIVKSLCLHADNNDKILTSNTREQFIYFARNAIDIRLKMNNLCYIKQQQTKRISMFMELCKAKMSMNSVKRQSSSHRSTDHNIDVGQPISIEHVLALIMYSQCTKLCTTFRETYRRLKDETTEQLMLRHSLFANMGRLLYEAFTFYGDTDAKVSTLYHGMNTELVFTTLQWYCQVPTSTTVDQVVATSFGDGGIVMKLENGSADRNIKTIDMSLFTCFDNECEHFIFGSELRIKDVYIPRVPTWVGKNIMGRLLLLDLLMNNEFVGSGNNVRLLKEMRQQGAFKILQRIADGTIPSYTKCEYANNLITSLIVKEHDITFNMKNTQSLIPELCEMFTDKNNTNTPLEIKYVGDTSVICSLRDHLIKAKSNSEIMIDFLKSIPMFSEIDNSRLREIQNSMHIIRKYTNENVFCQGDASTDFYIISGGTCSVFINNIRIRTLGKGDSFGELGIIQSQSRSATIRVTSDALEAFVLSASNFKSLLSNVIKGPVTLFDNLK